MADSASREGLIEALVQGLREIEAIRYGRLFSNTLIIYDYMCTFGREVDLIWRSRWSPIKVLFLVIRFGTYGLFSPHLTNRVSLGFIRWEMFTAFCSTMLAEGVLQIRIYALYGRDKRVLSVMVLFYVITTAIAAWAITTDMIQATSVVIALPGVMVCDFPALSKHTFGLWLPPLAFESGLCIMVLYKGYQTFKYTAVKNRTVALIEILVRDSVMYYLILSMLYTACFVVWLTEPAPYLEIPGATAVAMSCILGSRMIFNLREAAVKRQTSSAQNVIPLVALNGS
ncbi:hypothetical protein CPC08DRAFT_339187 [Agrocybe pediades]|nr:hypothetical protein CPC08DRAFT_339187 [Agrocybe pediades]